MLSGSAGVTASLGVTNNMRGGDGGTVAPCIQTILSLERDTGVVVPMLATDYEWSKDYKALILHLRKGVKFHDGTPCNANTIKWNYDRCIARKTAGTEFFTSVTVQDDYTVRINVPGFTQSLLPYMCGNILGSPLGLMMSPTAIDTLGETYNDTHPVGTGPFKFKAYKQNEYVEWERFDDYWGGKPYLDGVKNFFIADSVTQELAFEAGEGDINTGAGYQQLHELEGKGYQFLISTVSGLRFVLVPDGGHPDSVWSNEKVRMAAEYAIDKENLCQTIYYGYHTPSYFYDPPSVRPAESLASGKDDYFPGCTPRKYDPAKAKALLAEAGYPTGFKTTLYGFSGMIGEAAMAAVMANLKDVGIDTSVELISPAKWVDMETNGWHNGLMVSPTGNDASLPNYYLRFWWKPAAPNWSTGIYWDALLRPPELQALLDDYMSQPDPAKAYDDSVKVTQMVWSQCLSIPLYNGIFSAVAYPYVHDTKFYYAIENYDWQGMWMSKH